MHCLDEIPIDLGYGYIDYFRYCRLYLAYRVARLYCGIIDSVERGRARRGTTRATTFGNRDQINQFAQVIFNVCGIRTCEQPLDNSQNVSLSHSNARSRGFRSEFCGQWESRAFTASCTEQKCLAALCREVV